MFQHKYKKEEEEEKKTFGVFGHVGARFHTSIMDWWKLSQCKSKDLLLVNVRAVQTSARRARCTISLF